MDEFQKRNTDCVYFLASPLTCKKGFECEYRHSDIARLNPRDCWYWIAGNCLNPTCAFRHPPLDNLNEKLSESTAVPAHQFTTPPKKRDAPCYFYMNGFCSKGIQCSFSHGSAETRVSSKPQNPNPTVPNPPRSDIKPPSSGSESKAVPIKTLPNNLSQTAPTPHLPLQSQPNREAIEKPNPENKKVWYSDETLKCVEVEEETSGRKSESLDQAEDFAQNVSEYCSDESSGKVGERWESSPGFDVLVDSRSDTLDFQDPFRGYEFEEQVEYVDSKHSEPEDPYEEPYDCLTNDHGGSDYEACRVRYGENDLREHLRNRREIDYPTKNHHERPRRMRNFFHERKSPMPLREKHAISNKTRGRNGFRNRRHFEARRPVKKQRVASEVCVPFTGPKSLAMIREERQERGRENGDWGGFKGPKALSEILEEKRRVSF